MSNSAKPIGPLTIGNVVSAGLRIYRDRFKTYYSLALKAYLWILVPIYGWAKFSAIQGLISRLAFAEVNEQPETVRDAQGEVMPRMWSFLGAGILISLIFMGFFLGVAMVFLLFAIFIGAIFQDFTGDIIASLLITIGSIAFIIVFIWLAARLFVVEAALAIEDNINASKAIERSWELTQGSVGRIQWIIFVTFLITIPISVVFEIAERIITVVFTTSLPMADNNLFTLLYWVLIVGVNVAVGGLLIPFWQSITGVIYYDLRNRREGLGLKLKDRAR